MLDLEKLVYELLTRSLNVVDIARDPNLERVAVAPDLDVDSIDRFPMLTFTVIPGGSVDGAAPPIAWDTQVAINVFHDSLDGARALAARVYDAVWTWDDPWSGNGNIAGFGHATEIEDVSMFSRAGTVEINALSVTQYAGIHGMQLHQA